MLPTAAGKLALRRPGSQGRSLRAWDAADELLIESAQAYAAPEHRVLIVDDNFGALTLALEPLKPDVLADSATLVAALRSNATDNGRAAPVPGNWATVGAGRYDLIVLRIPRQLGYLEYLLRWANSALRPGGQVLAGGMIKHLPDRCAATFERLVVTRQVLPARKKARVVVCAAGEATLAGWQGEWQGYKLAALPDPITALPAVFSRDRLDRGTALFLPQVQRLVAHLPPEARVLDLACGNGVVGVSVLAQRPDVAVTFTDVSSQAVLSARHNVQTFNPALAARFHHSDGVPADAGLFDLILLNPPFHEGGTVGDHIALRLFREASHHLGPAGRLLVVGNRHLGYHKTLKRYFPRVTQCAADPKFVVFEAQPAGRV
ncbi:methyltransferase [Marinobacter sp. X15-166B]|nr:methyltransferase [Marinobacter sp. X15-166B]